MAGPSNAVAASHGHFAARAEGALRWTAMASTARCGAGFAQPTALTRATIEGRRRLKGRVSPLITNS